jgi:hypothetical protein
LLGIRSVKLFHPTIRRSQMFSEALLVGSVLSLLVFGAAAISGQQKAAIPSTPGVLEFPAVMEQNVTAGATPVGTKIKAKLTVATLVDGVVVPENAVFSGEVTESVAKSATGPSRLAMRMDSVHWKNRSVPIKVYLTGWYYPTRLEADLELAHGSPALNSPASQPFPNPETRVSSDLGLAAPLAVPSEHRVMMKNVKSFRNHDGSFVITCTSSNIKLDKTTSYVLGTGNLVAK